MPVGEAAALKGVGMIRELTAKVPLVTVVGVAETVLLVGAWVMVKLAVPVLALKLLSPE